MGGGTAQAAGQPNPIMAFMPMIFIFVVFYLLLIRPQQKKQKVHAAMVKALKKGDRIVSSGGLLGTVQSLQDDYVVIKVGDQGAKLEILRTAIQEVRKKS